MSYHQIIQKLKSGVKYFLEIIKSNDFKWLLFVNHSHQSIKGLYQVNQFDWCKKIMISNGYEKNCSVTKLLHFFCDFRLTYCVRVC